MSAQATSWAWGRRTPTPLAKLVLVALGNRADEFGVCYRGQKHLAELACCSVKAVRENLVRLETLGLVTRVERLRQNGSRTTDLYLLAPGGERGDMVWPNAQHEQWESLRPYVLGGEDGLPPLGGTESAGPGNRECPRGGTESTPHPDKPLEKPKASAEAARELFPETAQRAELMAVLDRVAEHKQTGRVTGEAVERIAAAFPAVDLLPVALELEGWALDGRGARRKIESLAQQFRTFVRIASERAVQTQPRSSVQSEASERDWDAGIIS